MRTYTYTLFLRHPETMDIQHGTVSLDTEGYLSWDKLFSMLSKETTIQSGYTLLGMQVVSVEDHE